MLIQLDPNYDPRQEGLSEKEELENSPYAEVRAAVPNIDDPHVHCVYLTLFETDLEHHPNVDNCAGFYHDRFRD
jgi:hypothetical protein